MLTLHEIGLIHDTDKATFHRFCDFYDERFTALRDKPVRLLEIGVLKGASLKMWSQYFSLGEIHAIDYIDLPIPQNVVFHKVNCENENELEEFAKTCGQFDIVIDDGGHTMKQQQLTIKHLWKRANFFYVIEDLHTSFKPYLNRCNAENWPVTFEMVKALRGESTFESPGQMQDDIDIIKKEISKLEIYCKVPNHYNNSVTCVIEKLRT